eukprot:Gb_17199 [translate_table: standard]
MWLQSTTSTSMDAPARGQVETQGLVSEQGIVPVSAGPFSCFEAEGVLPQPLYSKMNGQVMTDEQMEILRRQISVYATICQQLVEMHKAIMAQQNAFPGDAVVEQAFLVVVVVVIKHTRKFYSSKVLCRETVPSICIMEHKLGEKPKKTTDIGTYALLMKELESC